MQKVKPIYFAGLAYVQITSLPPVQCKFLTEHVPDVCRIRLTIGDEKLEDCIPYEDYERWYQLINPQYFFNYFESQI
jgi:hypothetical protein